MAETITGNGVVWGVDNNTFTGAIASATNASFVQSVRQVRDSKLVEVANNRGQTVAQVYHDFKKALSITVVPSGTSATLAMQSLDAWIPKAGQAVTITNGTNAPNFVDGVQSGKYNLKSATANQTNTGIATVDLELEQYEENDVTAAIS